MSSKEESDSLSGHGASQSGQPNASGSNENNKSCSFAESKFTAKTDQNENIANREGKLSLVETIENLGKLITEKLGLGSTFGGSDEDLSSSEKVLKAVSIEGIADYIKEGKAKNIITLAGAGISTSAGIPDFRSPKSGLYHNLAKYNLPYPEAIFEIGFFGQHPEPFFHLAKELFPGKFEPTPCHYFIRLLSEKGLLLRHYTQNIDTLEHVSGLPDDKIVEAHGTFYTSHCVSRRCRKQYNLDWLKEKLFSPLHDCPRCDDCDNIVKPDIVFFGENLPERFFRLSAKDFKNCDLLIVMGSSLAVQPFASLISRVNSKCPRLLINLEKAGEKESFSKAFGISSGDFDFDSEHNQRDVAHLGLCDDGCIKLAELLGWGDELRNLMKVEHDRFAKEEKDSKVKTSPEKQTGDAQKDKDGVPEWF